VKDKFAKNEKEAFKLRLFCKNSEIFTSIQGE
jgi:hypothetical protein